MKSLVLLIALMTSLSTIAWSAPQKALKCPARCVNLGNNSQYDGLCKITGEARGQSGCQQYETLGCVWEEKQPRTVSTAKCVNEGGNPQFDNFCGVVGQARGEEGCSQYTTLGCVWYKAQQSCR